MSAQAGDSVTPKRRGGGCLFTLAIAATLISAAVSVLSISGLVELDSATIPTPSSTLFLLSTPSWLEFLLFVSPTIALAGIVVLLRTRPGLAAGLISTCLALVAVACLVFVVAVAGQWTFCTISCYVSVSDAYALVGVPHIVDDLMFYATVISLVAIVLGLVLAGSSLVMALHSPPSGKAMEADSVT